MTVDVSSLAPFLVVDDDDLVAKSISRALRPFAPVCVARHGREALSAASTHRRLRGVIADICLGRESGLDVLASLRATHPTTEALVITGSENLNSHAKRIAALRAHCTVKPFDDVDLDAFIARAHFGDGEGGARVVAEIDRLQQVHGWTRFERCLVHHAVAGTPCDDLARLLREPRDTLKSQRRTLFRRLGFCSAKEIQEHVLFSALGIDRGGLVSALGLRTHACDD